MQSIRRRRECLYPDECWYCIWWFDDSTCYINLGIKQLKNRQKRNTKPLIKTSSLVII